MKVQWFKLKKPKSPQEQFEGMQITAYPTANDVRFRINGERVTVQHIAGNLTHQTMFQINGKYLVSMLDAYCELNGEPLPAQELHQSFLSTVATEVRRMTKGEGEHAKKVAENG